MVSYHPKTSGMFESQVYRKDCPQIKYRIQYDTMVGNKSKIIFL